MLELVDSRRGRAYIWKGLISSRLWDYNLYTGGTLSVHVLQCQVLQLLCRNANFVTPLLNSGMSV